MDPATHALTSFALARGFFPHHSWRFAASVVLAGTLADIDLLTLLFGPSAYLSGRLTIAHSVVGTVLVIAVAAAFFLSTKPKNGSPQKAGPPPVESFSSILLATSFAAAVHLLMDSAASGGVALLWPFRPTRFAWDLFPEIDPWILALLFVGIFLPELFRLVSSEIGTKQKSPCGRNGAMVSLALLLIYAGGRAALHASALTQFDAHSYRGESTRRVAALPDSLSPIIWHGVVETASQICTADLPVAGTGHFDSESATCVHKPEESVALNAAQKTQSAQEFLQAARFPKASVDATADGFEVVLRDVVQNETLHALAARILLDRSGRVARQSIVWARHIMLR